MRQLSSGLIVLLSKMMLTRSVCWVSVTKMVGVLIAIWKRLTNIIRWLTPVNDLVNDPTQSEQICEFCQIG